MLSAKISNATRKAVYRREGYRCAICDSTKYLQVHHCVKRSRGGTDEIQNLVCLCADCHALAHGINLNGWEATREDMQQAIVEYLADYYAPNWNPWSRAAGPWNWEECMECRDRDRCNGGVEGCPAFIREGEP